MRHRVLAAGRGFAFCRFNATIGSEASYQRVDLRKQFPDRFVDFSISVNAG